MNAIYLAPCRELLLKHLALVFAVSALAGCYSTARSTALAPVPFSMLAPPQDGTLELTELLVTQGLYSCVQVAYISKEGTKTMLSPEADVRFSGAEAMLQPLAPFAGQRCPGFAFFGTKVGETKLRAHWGAAVGAASAEVDGTELGLEPRFTLEAVGTGLSSPITVNTKIGTRGFVHMASLELVAMPAKHTHLGGNAAGERALVASAPGTYSLLAVAGRKAYPSANRLHVYDLSRTPVTTLRKDFLRVEPAVLQPEYAMLNKAMACRTLTPVGVYRAEGRHVYGLVPEATFALTTPGGSDATLEGNVLCAHNPGGVNVRVSGPGVVEPLDVSFALDAQ